MRALIAAVALVSAPAAAAPPGVMALVRADRWAEAQAAAARLPDPVAGKLVTFYRLLTPGAARLAEIDAFRAANPDWPLAATLLRRRDEAILAEPDDATAAAACVQQAPHAAAALLRCADGERRLGQAAPATLSARAAWIAATPDARWDAAFLRDWAAAVGAAENRARFDRLAWSDPAAAAQQISRLAPEDRQAAQARLALRRDDPQAEALLAVLPATQQATPPMLLEHAAWLRRRGHLQDATALWRGGQDAERAAPAAHRPAFWDERNRLARTLLQQGDASDAYAVADDTAQAAPEAVADAAFLAGWIALRRLGDPARAASHFVIVGAVSHAAITVARAHYWLGRAAAAAGDAAAAAREYGLAAGYPSTFYGQLAALAAGDDPARLAARIVATRDPGWSRAQASSLADSELARASAWLVGWGEPGRAAAFLLRLSDLAPSPADRALGANLAAGFAMPPTAVALARLAGRAGVVLLDTGWPVAARVAPDAGVDPALALGVIRQESSFDPAVVSPAGARGLMQLMPATAAAVARKLTVPVSLAGLTADPAYNVTLGSAYLMALLRQFDGTVPLAAAGYNAGPGKVAAWLAVNGDPRRPGTDLNAMVDWVELIPFSETRNYVQRVIENTVIYQAKLGEAAPLPLPWPHSPA